MKLFELLDWERKYQKKIALIHGTILMVFIILITYKVFTKPNNEKFWYDLTGVIGIVLLLVSAGAVFISFIKIYNKMPDEKKKMHQYFLEEEHEKRLKKSGNFSFALEVIMRCVLRFYLIVLFLGAVLITISQQLLK
jgi:protein-S-isoprenylcysteine O-methyltransferase Ste14